MLGLGLASSHAPALFEPQEMWPLIYSRRPAYTKDSQPHTAKLETPEVIQGYIDRINVAFDILRQQLQAYRPEALIVVGDDQGDMFDDRLNPTFCIFTGEKLWGLDGTNYRPLENRHRIDFPCHAPLAQDLHKGLIKKGFDVASSAVFAPMGRPEHGVSHMVAHPIPTLVPQLDIPIVPIFMNEYFPPLPTAERCYNLGAALADILAERPERVAIYASGGLSHDPTGPRAGWVDEPLDRWFLERLERNDSEALKHLFTFDSDTLRGGTGEIRAWITVAGAMRRPAKVLEYIGSHHAKVGLGFAYWPAVDTAPASRT
jgi:protocatechuate 4,5-dioxygenase beta chain